MLLSNTNNLCSEERLSRKNCSAFQWIVVA